MGRAQPRGRLRGQELRAIDGNIQRGEADPAKARLSTGRTGQVHLGSKNIVSFGVVIAGRWCQRRHRHQAVMFQP